jgi:hypothetical protein
MLKEPCPYYKEPTNHNLEYCHMLWRYFESLGIKKDNKRRILRATTRMRGFPRFMTIS